MGLLDSAWVSLVGVGQDDLSEDETFKEALNNTKEMSCKEQEKSIPV